MSEFQGEVAHGGMSIIDTYYLSFRNQKIHSEEQVTNHERFA